MIVSGRRRGERRGGGGGLFERLVCNLRVQYVKIYLFLRRFVLRERI